MRIYGMRSGRNNMSRLIARSIMYNSKKSKPKAKTSVTPTTTTNVNETDSVGGILFIAFLYVIIIVLLFH